MKSFMLMDFPDNYIIFATFDVSRMRDFEAKRVGFINRIFEDYGVFFHVINDVHKTCRPLNIHVEKKKKDQIVGYSRDRYLIGMFMYGKKSRAMSTIERVHKEFANLLNIKLEQVEYNESASQQQLSLF
jgi:hypothetical protein